MVVGCWLHAYVYVPGAAGIVVAKEPDVCVGESVIDADVKVTL